MQKLLPQYLIHTTFPRPPQHRTAEATASSKAAASVVAGTFITIATIIFKRVASPDSSNVHIALTRGIVTSQDRTIFLVRRGVCNPTGLALRETWIDPVRPSTTASEVRFIAAEQRHSLARRVYALGYRAGALGFGTRASVAAIIRISGASVFGEERFDGARDAVGLNAVRLHGDIWPCWRTAAGTDGYIRVGTALRQRYREKDSSERE